MSSVTSICNAALAHLGQNQIMAVTDESQTARFCNVYYEPTRDEILASHPWKFALKREVLSQLTTTPVSEWDYEFQLPADCIRVMSANACWWWGSEGVWVVEGGKLLTHSSGASIKYIHRITDAVKFTPLFCEALAVKLASKLAMPLTGDKGLKQEMMVEYRRVTGPEARRVDAFEGRPAIIPPAARSPFVASRLVGGGTGSGYVYGSW